MRPASGRGSTTSRRRGSSRSGWTGWGPTRRWGISAASGGSLPTTATGGCGPGAGGGGRGGGGSD
ncbi:MAG: hypothetical protein F4Z83_09790 [Gemmatimonadetes bacterium]|nr:hypothetical protein [Gemmatimonadota bacterium]